MYRTLLVALGGSLGSVARYWLGSWLQYVIGSDIPIGTLVVNIVGSFILGVVMTLSLDRSLISPEVRILLGAGFCGGFTTMSAFAYESVALFQYGSSATAAAYIGWTLATCVLATWAGVVAARML